MKLGTTVPPYDNGRVVGPWDPKHKLYIRSALFRRTDIRFDVTVPNGNYQINWKVRRDGNIGSGQPTDDFEGGWGNVVLFKKRWIIQASAGETNLAD